MGKKRTRYDITLNKPDEFVETIINDYLKKQEYRQIVLKDELIWQSGISAIAAPKCFKYSYLNGILHIEAWFMKTIIGNLIYEELDLSGHWIRTVEYKNEIEDLIKILQQNIPDYNSVQTNNTYEQQINHIEPVMINGFDLKRNATKGFIISLISLIISLGLVCVLIFADYALVSVPLILISAWGITEARKGQNSSKQELGIAGMVMGTISIIIQLIIAILITIAKFI